MSGEFFLNNATGTRSTTMDEYKTIDRFFNDKNLYLFTFYSRAEDITVALQEIGYIISVKQMTAKRPTQKGMELHTFLTLFLVTLSRNQKAPEIFKLTALCNVVIHVEIFNVLSIV
jgi:hypothetical protein